MRIGDFQIESDVLKKYGGTAETVIIPEGVTAIGESAFSHNEYLKSVVIPKTVTKIENYAFLECRHLESVIIPESVTEIGASTFCNCHALTSINISGAVSIIRKSSFLGCDNLTEITIPRAVTSIEEGAFSFCRKLTKIIIPEHVTSIGISVFYNCENLKHIRIDSQELSSIGSRTFQQCALTEISLPDSITTITEGLFLGCEQLKKIKLPKYLTNIEKNAFVECKSLSALEIPETVTEIGESAFHGCRGLTALSLPPNITEIRYGTFMYSGVKKLVIPEGVTNIGKQCFFNSDLTELVIPSSVTALAPNTFQNTGFLEKITVSEQNPIYASYDGALYDKHFTTLICSPTQKTELLLPDGVTEFAPGCFGFYYIQNLNSVTYQGITCSPLNGKFLSVQVYHLYALMDMLTKKDFSAELPWHNVTREDVVSKMFMRYPDDEKILSYLREHVSEISRFLIKHQKTEILSRILEIKLITASHIDDLIQCAIDNRQYEIQIMLMDYKATYIGYESQEEIIRKKFEL